MRVLYTLVPAGTIATFIPSGVSGSSLASFRASMARPMASSRVISSRYCWVRTLLALSLLRPMAVALYPL